MAFSTDVQRKRLALRQGCQYTQSRSQAEPYIPVFLVIGVAMNAFNALSKRCTQ